jgi:NADH-quinone oxidoreductase subunit I
VHHQLVAVEDCILEIVDKLDCTEVTCVDTETGKKKRKLVDYQYDLGDCMFCELCVNACNFGAIKFVNDFENAVFDRNKLVMHLDKEVYKGGSLPNLIDGGAPLEIGKFNTKTK